MIRLKFTERVCYKSTVTEVFPQVDFPIGPGNEDIEKLYVPSVLIVPLNSPTGQDHRPERGMFIGKGIMREVIWRRAAIGRCYQCFTGDIHDAAPLDGCKGRCCSEDCDLKPDVRGNRRGGRVCYRHREGCGNGHGAPARQRWWRT